MGISSFFYILASISQFFSCMVLNAIILIRKAFIHQSSGQIDQKLSKAVDQNVHEPAAFVGGGSARVAHSRVSRGEMPRPRDADPAAIDRVQLGGSCGARVG